VPGLIHAQTVIGVQAKGDRFVFVPLRRAGDLRMNCDVTILPPTQDTASHGLLCIRLPNV